MLTAGVLFFAGCYDDDTGSIKVVNGSVYYSVKNVEIRGGSGEIVVSQNVSISDGGNKRFDNLLPGVYKTVLTDNRGERYETSEFDLDAGQIRIVEFYYRPQNSNADKYGVECRSER